MTEENQEETLETTETAKVEEIELQKVKWNHKKNYLNESYQKTGFNFILASDNTSSGILGMGKKKQIEACHEWVKCRDYLHDVVRCQLTSGSCDVYGFSYGVGKNPNLNLNKIRMLVSKETLITRDKPSAKEYLEDFKVVMAHSLTLLNHFENEAKISLSTLKYVDPEGSNREIVALFTGSHIWLKSPFLVSMYSMLIRMGDKKITFKSVKELEKELRLISKKGDDNDAAYLASLWDKLHLILNNRDKLFTEGKDGFHDIYYNKHNITSFHNNCGVLSLATFITPDKELNARMKECLNLKQKAKG